MMTSHTLLSPIIEASVGVYSGLYCVPLFIAATRTVSSLKEITVIAVSHPSVGIFRLVLTVISRTHGRWPPALSYQSTG